jgi:outer membrane receptor protein involved in Fe transport
MAQDYSAYGIILDDINMPVGYANVLLQSQEDETLLLGTSTAEDGTFKIDNINSGTYTLKITYLGYKEVSQKITIESDLDIGPVILKETAETLDAVSVIAKKPTLKKEKDRLIFNVANTALVEGSMIDVVKSAPTVMVLDNAITIKNQTPTVYINDRKINLSSQEIVQLLETASASSIKSVEVITTPGAQYDADGGVVLNIVMGKNLVTGYRGRVFSNYTQGVFPRYNAGTSHFFKNNKVNLNVNYSYNNNKINRNNDAKIFFLNEDNATNELWRSDINRNTWSETHNISSNFDYNINDQNTISLTSSVLFMPYFKYLIKNNTNIFDANNNFESNFNSKTLSYDNKYNVGFDIDYVSRFKNNSRLALNGHYTKYDYDRDQAVMSEYFLQDNSLDFTNAYNTSADTETNILTAQADYKTPLSEKANLSLGVKGAFVETDSGIIQRNLINGQEIIDPDNTNTFVYNEDVLAAYANYNHEFEKLSLSAGVRLEQTNVKGQSETQTITQDYLELFPTLSLGYQATEKLNTYVNYKRSIERPSYQLINPFRVFLNDNIIVEGNPNLQPSFSNHWVVGLSINDTHTFEAYLKNTKDNFGEFPFQNNVDNTLVYTSSNYGDTTEFGLDYVTYFTLFKKLSTYFVTSFYYTKDEATINNQSIELDQWSNYSELSGDMSFLKDQSLTATLSLVYASKNLQALQISEGLLFSELSLRKTILNKKGALSLVVSDLFNKQDFTVSTRYLNQRNSTFTDSDTRYVKLGFSYKFGNTTLQTNANTKERNERDRLEKN